MSLQRFQVFAMRSAIFLPSHIEPVGKIDRHHLRAGKQRYVVAFDSPLKIVYALRRQDRELANSASIIL